jgi:hypothetical protein
MSVEDAKDQSGTVTVEQWNVFVVVPPTTDII